MNKESRVTFTWLLLTAVLVVSTLPFAESNQPRVLLVEVSGYISPATQDHVFTAINEASRLDCAAVLMTIDTFGGSVDSMFNIVASMQRSRIPIIGFVYPAGGQALSAGTYILLASDYSAMAPYTTIGSAQPVIGTTPTNESKYVNFLVEKMVGYARLHGRNETQARRFITDNDNLLAEDALGRHVIEAVASSPEELMAKAEGAKVNTLFGERTLNVAGAEIIRFERSVRVRLLEVFTDPLISSLMIGIGFLVLVLGLMSPGWGAEVAGIVMLILGLAGQGFNVNISALALMAIGSALLFYELKTPGFGVIGIGGMVIFAIGMGLIVTYPPEPLLVSREWVNVFIWTTLGVMSVAGGFFSILVYKAVQATRMKRRLGGLPKGEGRAVDDLGPDKLGYVVVEGEYWKAKSREPVPSGSRVQVTGAEGKILTVEKKES